MKSKVNIRQKNGKWCLFLNIEVEGVIKKKWFGLNLSADEPLSEVYKKLEELGKDSAKEQNTKEENLMIEKCQNSSIEYFFDIFLEYKKDKVQQVTYDDYCGDLRYISRYFSKLDLKFKDYNILHIQQFVSYLLGKNLSASTINRYINMLSNVFGYAVFLGVLKKNIINQIERPKIKKKEYAYYDSKQLKYLCAKLEKEDSVYSLPIIITATYGLRQSEILGLLWSSIDFEQNKIYINNKVICSQKGYKRTTYSSHTMKSKSSERTLPLLSNIKTLLKKRKDQIAQNISNAKDDYCKEFLDYVCVNNLGKLISPTTLYLNFEKIIAKLKLPKIRFHDLRHSSASMLVSNKISIKTIQEWMGHSNYRTTANVYAHTNTPIKNECAKKIQNLLFDNQFLTYHQKKYLQILCKKIYGLKTKTE